MASNGGGGFSPPSGGDSPGGGGTSLGKRPKLSRSKGKQWDRAREEERKRKRAHLGNGAANVFGPDAPSAKAAKALGAAAASRPRAGPGVHPPKTNDAHAKSNCTTNCTPNAQSLGAAASVGAGQHTSGQDVEKRTWGE